MSSSSPRSKTAPRPVLTAPIRAERLSDKVAAQLQQLMMSRELKSGDKLPAERELCEQMGVSRTVIREAVRSLAAKGLLDVRAGGGTVVRAPDSGAVSEMMALMLRPDHGAVAFEHVHEVRRNLEVEIAALAAQRRTEHDLLAMRAQLAEMAAHAGDPEVWAAADVAFHAAVAAATHNPLYPLLLGSITDMLLEVRLTGIRLRGTPARALRHHENIHARIAAGDASGARQAMREHLAESEDTFRRAARRAA